MSATVLDEVARFPVARDDPYPTTAPEAVHRATMIQRWERISFLHWPYDAAVVQALLPRGLEVDTFDGSAWVGLLPFRLRIRLPGLPQVPWAGRFAETNVRTYVRGPDGRAGIWFLSLDAARLGAVAVARGSHRLPYVWSWMRMRDDGDEIRYAGRRRWPDPGDAAFDVAVRPGEPIAEEDLTDRDRFLTARWRLYSPGRLELPARDVALVATQVEHEPWPLRRADIVDVRQNLLQATGLPAPEGSPLALFSHGVHARFDRRRPV